MSIRLEQLQFSYPDRQQLVVNIPEWQLQQGECVFLHGPSGSGKSTLLKLLSGMSRPTSGQVIMLEQDLAKLSASKRDQFRANHIGHVFQQFNLIPYLNAIENVALANAFSAKAKKATNQEITALLSTLSITAEQQQLKTEKLSVGQQQRVAIARALINKPEILIADEPTSALDETNSHAFLELLMQHCQTHNTSLVFVSHDMRLSSHFSRCEALSDINQVEAATC